MFRPRRGRWLRPIDAPPLRALVLGATLALAACGNSAAGWVAGEAAVGVCTARQALPDTAEAAARFQNEAHEAIHALAEAPGLDRAVAADLFTAKVRVETDLADAEPAERLGADLVALQAAVDRAATDLGFSTPSCAVAG